MSSPKGKFTGYSVNADSANWENICLRKCFTHAFTDSVRKLHQKNICRRKFFRRAILPHTFFVGPGAQRNFEILYRPLEGLPRISSFSMGLHRDWRTRPRSSMGLYMDLEKFLYLGSGGLGRISSSSIRLYRDWRIRPRSSMGLYRDLENSDLSSYILWALGRLGKIPSLRARKNFKLLYMPL